jgi:nitrogen fixation protein NifU and related proteins
MPLSADPPPVPPVIAPSAQDIGIASLYQDIILSHYRAPKHKGVLATPTAAVEQRNPLCGDVLSVQLQLRGEQIVDGAFSARACSITQATASMLLSRIIGGTANDARTLIGDVDRLIDTAAPLATPADDTLGDLRALQSVARFPARKACVRLVTSALTEALAPH